MATSSQHETPLHQGNHGHMSPLAIVDSNGLDMKESARNAPDGHVLDGELPDSIGTDDSAADSLPRASQDLGCQPSGRQGSGLHFMDSEAPGGQVLNLLKAKEAKRQKQEQPRPKWFRQARSEPQEAPVPSFPRFPHLDVRRPPNEPRRPKNAFMLFSAEERLKLKHQGRGQDNRTVSRILGARWRAMSAAEKRPFQEEAVKLYRQVKMDHPNWRYSPAVFMAREPEVVQTSRLRPRDKVKWKLPPLLKRSYRRRDGTTNRNQTSMSLEMSDHAPNSEAHLSKESHQKLSVSPLVRKRMEEGGARGKAFREKVAKKRRMQKPVLDIEIDRDEVNTPGQGPSSIEASLPIVDRVWTEVWRSDYVALDREEVESDCEDDAYGCSICGKWFRSSEAVEAHIFTHSNQKKSKPTKSRQGRKKKQCEQSMPVTVEVSSDEGEHISSSTSTAEESSHSPGNASSSRLAIAEGVGTGKMAGASGGDEETKMKAALELQTPASQGITEGKNPNGGLQWIMVPLDQLQNMVSVKPTMILVPADKMPALTNTSSKTALHPSFAPQNPMASITISGNIAAKHHAVPGLLQGMGAMKQVK